MKNPKTLNALFSSGDEWHYNACLNFSSDEWYTYKTGYKQAADFLAQYVISHVRNQDILIYPIIFLYRQYIELSIKGLIFQSSILLDKNIKIEETHSHNIHKLWNQCNKLLMEIVTDEDKKMLNDINIFIIEFNNVDPLSESFRYPTNKKGQRSLPNQRYINIKNFKNRIDNVSIFLDGAYEMIRNYKDI